MLHAPSRRVRRALLRTLLALPALGLAAARAPASTDPAAALAQEVFDRPSGRDSTAYTRMELTERGRAPRVRELVTYRQSRPGGASAALIRFLESL